MKSFPFNKRQAHEGRAIQQLSRRRNAVEVNPGKLRNFPIHPSPHTRRCAIFKLTSADRLKETRQQRDIAQHSLGARHRLAKPLKTELLIYEGTILFEGREHRQLHLSILARLT